MSSKDQFFRANVGAVIGDATGRVLAFERADIRGAWQLPQGGLEANETPEIAVFREAFEETGIPVRALKLVAPHPELLAYELPEHLRSKKSGRGQVQYWFYLKTEGREPGLPPGGEFCAWRWLELRELASEVVAFRQPVYAKLADYFDAEVRSKLKLTGSGGSRA